MAKLGILLVVGGVLVGIGWLIYYWFSAALVPLPLKIIVAVVAFGLVLLVLSVARDRIRAAKQEKYKEVEH